MLQATGYEVDPKGEFALKEPRDKGGKGGKGGKGEGGKGGGGAAAGGAAAGGKGGAGGAGDTRRSDDRDPLLVHLERKKTIEEVWCILN